MDTIPYRNGKIMVKIIPKGTVLFRLVSKINNDELRGVKIAHDERCIIPNHNVFFYPNPFAAKLTLDLWVASSTIMTAYVLKNDIKVIWLLQPSKHGRTTMNTKRNFIKRCSKVKRGCLPKRGVGILAGYNVCVSDTIIKKFPDVVGVMAIAAEDARRLNENLRRKTQKITKYFHFAEAVNTKIPSVPELILHPLKSRPQKDIIVHQNDTLENNYELYKKFDTRDENKLIRFMDSLVYNPETFFFELKNQL
jgi:hypothetical protein